jgi:hypothetical protein
MIRAIEIAFSDSEALDIDYPLRPLPPCTGCGTREITNYLAGDGLNIQVNINGIEAPDAADHISAGSVRFQSLSGRLQFHFSFTFSDRKLLHGTFNLPIEQDLHCPLPTL